MILSTSIKTRLLQQPLPIGGPCKTLCYQLTLGYSLQYGIQLLIVPAAMYTCNTEKHIDLQPLQTHEKGYLLSLLFPLPLDMTIWLCLHVQPHFHYLCKLSPTGILCWDYCQYLNGVVLWKEHSPYQMSICIGWNWQVNLLLLWIVTKDFPTW